jgi:hypothetical protein
MSGTTRLAGASLLVATLQLFSAQLFSAAQALTSEATIYVDVIDSQKRHVAGLGIADLFVKEDGVERPVISAEPAAAEMQIAILVDDNGTGIFRFGLNALGELLQGRATIALSVITNQVQRVFDYTTDSKIWFAGFGRTGLRPATPEGGQLLEGIFSAVKDITRREPRRPVIIALTVGGEEQSPLPSRRVLDELNRSRASLHVLFVDIPSVRPTRPAAKPSDLLEGNFNLNRVLGDGPGESGGRRREVLAMNALTVEVQAIARDLLAQYAITYSRGTARNPQKLQVSVRRPNMAVIAPTRAPWRQVQ